jgi:hypothetical protein
MSSAAFDWPEHVGKGKGKSAGQEHYTVFLTELRVQLPFLLRIQ